MSEILNPWLTWMAWVTALLSGAIVGYFSTRVTESRLISGLWVGLMAFVFMVIVKELLLVLLFVGGGLIAVRYVESRSDE